MMPTGAVPFIAHGTHPMVGHSHILQGLIILLIRHDNNSTFNDRGLGIVAERCTAFWAIARDGRATQPPK
jgi:hypothetical protein